MQNFIISLAKNNSKRRDHMQNEFEKQNINFEFFEAITPNFNTQLLQKYELNEIQSELVDREISCFLSHYVLWQKIVENNIKFAGIFEDDIFLGENAEIFLTNSDWIDSDIDIIKLEKGWQKTIKTPFQADKELYSRTLYKLQSAHYGTAGYIISNKGAKYLIEKYKKLKRIEPIDVIIFEKLLKEKHYKVQQLLPAICVQDFILNNGLYVNFESELAEDRAKNYPLHPVKKKTVWFKVKREITKPFINLFYFIYKKIFIKEVDFQ